MSEPTMRELHAVMGELLDMLDEIPELHDVSTTTWTVGRQPSGKPELRVCTVGDGGREVLDAANRLLGAGQEERDDRVVTSLEGRSRMTTLHTVYSGVPVQVTAWVHEPEDGAE